MAKTIKIVVRLQPNLENVIGLPVRRRPSDNIVGEVVEYNKETGETTVEIEPQTLDELLKINDNIVFTNSDID